MAPLDEYPENEQARLNALRNLGLLDTPPSESFDRLTRLASSLLGAPVSTISLTDADRQWFKSRVGCELTEIPREQAPCSYAIQGEGVFEVCDLLLDPRFADSPLTRSGIRYYAGAPLVTRSGYGLGTLCIIDVKPRALKPEEARILLDLAGMVMCQVELQNMIGRTDAGSGLPNQYQLFEDLEGLASTRGAERVVLLAIDILSAEQAEHVLRVLGAPPIDAVAQAGMRRISELVGAAGRLYHIGPHRCVVLVHGEQAGEQWLAASVRHVLADEILVDDIPVTPQPVVGLYEFDLGAAAPRDALRRAINAVSDARFSPSATSHYDHGNEQRAARRLALLSDFGSALDAPDQLSLVYQPRVDLRTGQWVGVEALIRWQHPRFGAVPPGEFVPLVERIALARGLTEWVAQRAILQARQWRDAGRPLKVSINASAVNLVEEDFAERLIGWIRAAGVEPGLVELEFTESAMA